jgi:hypothetical protein
METEQKETPIAELLGCTSNGNLQPNESIVDLKGKVSAAFLIEKMWAKNAVLRVSFLSDGKKENVWTKIIKLQALKNIEGLKVPLDPLEEEIRKLDPIDAVKKVVNERLQPLIGLKFEFMEYKSDGSGLVGDIRVDFNKNQGCWALLGKDCLTADIKKPTVNFGWLDVGVICHEFGHVLGLVHEHSNVLGKTIDWNQDEVYKWAKAVQGWDKETAKRNIIDKYKKDQINGTNFDRDSIMLYFYDAKLTKDKKGTDPNARLSIRDVLHISKVYTGGKVDPRKFYFDTYGIQITDKDVQEAYGEQSSNYLGIIILLLLLIFVAFAIYKYYKKSSYVMSV